MAFDEPEPSGGDHIYPDQLLNHLLMVWAIDYIPHSQTKYTRPDKLSDVIVVDCVDLDTPDENNQPGVLYRKTWWRAARLIGSLKGKLGRPDPVLVRMGQGIATMGKPPYELVSATSDAQCVHRANAWLAAHPDFVPSVAGGFQAEPATTKPVDHWGKPEEQPVWSGAPQQAKVQQSVPAETVLERMARLSREQQEAAARLPAARPGFEEEIPY